MSYKPNTKWQLNAAWLYRSGWPYTKKQLASVQNPDGSYSLQGNFGRLNGERYPAYHRMDLRLSRFIRMKNNGLLSFFIEMRNIYNRKNIRVINAIARGNSTDGYTISEERESWLPLLPSFGISYDF